MFDRKKYYKEWRKKHREEINKENKKYREKHKKERKEYDKKYYQENKEKKDKRVRKWVKENLDKRRKIVKKYAKNNPDKIKKKNRKYAKANPEKLKENTKKWLEGNGRDYAKNRRKVDTKYHLNCNISTAIYQALEERKANRHWEGLVGYTLLDLITRLESQFDKNMNWGNYGSYWSIDHKKPKSLFYFNSTEEQTFKNCWCLANLQPLEKIENMKKGNKFLLRI